MCMSRGTIVELFSIGRVTNSTSDLLARLARREAARQRDRHAAGGDVRMEQQQPEPTLYPGGSEGVCHAFNLWADRVFFWSTVPVL